MAEIEQWLLNLGAEEFTGIFLSNGYTTPQSACHLSQEDLRKMGMTKLRTRKNVYNALQVADGCRDALSSPASSGARANDPGSFAAACAAISPGGEAGQHLGERANPGPSDGMSASLMGGWGANGWGATQARRSITASQDNWVVSVSVSAKLARTANIDNLLFRPIDWLPVL
jgi:hypothetical protein